MYRIVRKPPLLWKRGSYYRPVTTAGFDEIPIITLCKFDFHKRILVATKVTSNGGTMIGIILPKKPRSRQMLVSSLGTELTITRSHWYS
jgi:hypothetical protein